jgi:hypothetical protein
MMAAITGIFFRCLNSWISRYGAVDAHDERLDALVLLRLPEHLLHAGEEGHLRRRRREGKARRVVGEETGEIDDQDLGRAGALDGVLLERANAGLEIERDDGAAAEEEGGEHGDEGSARHGPSIRAPSRRHKRPAGDDDRVNYNERARRRGGP